MVGSCNRICIVDYDDIVAIILITFDYLLFIFISIFNVIEIHPIFPSYFINITFKFSLGIYKSCIKFRSTKNVSTNPPIASKQPKTPYLENMSNFTRIRVGNKRCQPPITVPWRTRCLKRNSKCVNCLNGFRSIALCRF